MKILLIYPDVLEKRIHEEDVGVVPIGLYYIGAMLLHHGHEVKIVNGHELGGEKARMQAVIESFQPEVIGCSILNANRWGGIEIVELAKKINPDIKIVFGGIGATYLWNHFLTHFNAIDYIVLEEGEHTFLELIQCLENGDSTTLAAIRGLAFRDGGQSLRTPRRESVAALDQLPDPARFFTFQHVALTRGCPGNCTFCGSPNFWGRGVRFHSADYFVTQLQRLHAKGVRNFFFCDDTFTLKKDAVIEVCRLIIARKLAITFVAISKVGTVDAEVLSWMRRAGCTQISYGIESGSKGIRRIFGKKLDDAQIQNAFDLTVRYGILARAYFIYGAPGETRATISQTLALIQRIKPLAAIFYILTLFPGTALYHRYQDQMGLNDDIWLNPMEDILYFETDSALTREMVLEFGRLLRTEYHRALPDFAEKITLIDLPEFYPLHADFLSRLGMTFSHGDYAAIDAVPNKHRTAIQLYQRSLAYHPNERAYLGLGVLHQQNRRFADSLRILEQGLEHFPESRPLTLCLGVSLMNVGDFKRALACFETFPEADESKHFTPICRQSLSNRRR